MKVIEYLRKVDHLFSVRLLILLGG